MISDFSARASLKQYLVAELLVLNEIPYTSKLEYGTDCEHFEATIPVKPKFTTCKGYIVAELKGYEKKIKITGQPNLKKWLWSQSEFLEFVKFEPYEI